MTQLERQDIRIAEAYEQPREAERRRIAELKRHRRVNLGHRLSLVFENRETLRNAIEELVRAERIADEDVISAEVEAFNQLLPTPGNLSASLYIEVSDPAELDTVAETLAGVERSVSLRIDGQMVSGQPLLVTSEEPSALIHQLRFELNDAQRHAWLDDGEVVAVVQHPACGVEVPLSSEQHSALAADFS